MAAIGLAVGAGLYVAGLATTVIVLVILAGVKPIEERVRERTQTRQVIITARRDTVSMATLHDVLGGRAARVKQFILRQGTGDEHDAIEVTFTRLTREATDDLVAKLRATPGVIEIEAGSGRGLRDRLAAPVFLFVDGSSIHKQLCALRDWSRGMPALTFSTGAFQAGICKPDLLKAPT